MRKLTLAFYLISFVFLFGSFNSSAQITLPLGDETQQQPQTQPQFFITWKAKSYAPPTFSGKILPAANSPITASFEILDPLTGKFVDLSQMIIDPDTGKLTTRAAYKAKRDRTNKELFESIGSEDQFVPDPLPPPPTINWYVNDQLLKTRSGGAPGSQTISFRAPGLRGGVELKIQLSDFDPNGLFFTVLNIPVVQPEVVIETLLPGKQFGTPSTLVKAVPYFFNVTSPAELSYSWSVNGQAPPGAENPMDLTVNVNPEAPSGSTISISISVENPKSKSETAGSFLDLIYLK